MPVSYASREGISLAEFVPKDVQLSLSQGENIPASVTGAVLFVDIVGFSTLASKLVAEHRATEGAERLSVLLEQAYSELIAPVHAQGGSVIGFSGDAMTCWFAGEVGHKPAHEGIQTEKESELGAETDPELAAVRALTAARAMRQALLQLDMGSAALSSGGRLAARFCIAAGQAWRAEVGSPKFQRLSVIGGALMARIAAADALAGPGQILLDAIAAEDVGKVVGSRLVSGYLVVEATASTTSTQKNLQVTDFTLATVSAAVSESTLLEWVPHGARAPLRQAPEFLGTFKPIVAVFIQFGHSKLETEDELDAAATTDFVAGAQSVFEAFGGRVVDITIGEKGSYIFAAFGDLRVHEDDGRRALLAVLTLKGQSDPKHGEFSVGIARGPAYAGLIGGAGRRTFGVIGLEVTLAARLMVTAQSNEVLVTDSVRLNAGAEFDFVDTRDEKFKGFADPISVSSLTGVKEAGDSVVEYRNDEIAAPTLFGRDDNVAELSAAVDRLLKGVSGVVELTGETGIGKTALVRVASARAKAVGVRVLTSAGRALSSGSFSLWSSVLPEGDHPPSRSFEPDLSAAGRADRITDDLVAALCQFAQTMPVLFVLEDLHWADSESLRVLRQFVIAAPTALIVTTTRNDASCLEAGVIPESWVARRLDLEVLPAAALRPLIATTLEAHTLATPILDFISQQADGSPLFAKELALALRDTGVVRVVRHHAQLRDATTALDSSMSSETVQSIIAARIDDLPAIEQIVVKAASVIGRRFAPATLEQVVASSLGPSKRSDSTSGHVAGSDRGDLRSVTSALENLADLEILQVVDGDGNYAFRHALTREVVYGTLLHEHRARLHLRVAHGLEQQQVISDAGELQLAHHWWLAATGLNSGNAADRAIHYLQRAGERALHLSAHGEALSCFTRALNLVQENKPLLGEDQLAHWHASAAAAELGLGRFDDCAQSCRAALDSLGYPLPRHPGFAIPLEIVRQLRRRLQGRGFHRAVALTELQGDPKGRRLQQASEVLRILSKSYFFANDFIPSIYVNLRQMNLSEQLGPGKEVALSYTTTQLTLGVIGRHVWAQAYGRESLAMAETVESSAARATLFLNNAVYRLSIGDWQLAQRYAGAAETLATQHGDFAQLAEAVAVKADVALLTGKIETSSELYRSLFIEAERRGRWLEQAWSVRPEAQRALRAGSHAKAIELLDRHLGVLAPLNDPLIAIDVHGMRSLALARSGQDKLAREAAIQALTLVERVAPPVTYPRYLGLVALVEALLLLDGAAHGGSSGGPLSVSAETKRAIAGLAAYARVFPFAMAARELFNGWVLAMQGKLGAAAKHLLRARELAEEYAFAYEEARACAMLSLSVNHASERQRYADSARSGFDRLVVGAGAKQLEGYLEKGSAERT